MFADFFHCCNFFACLFCCQHRRRGGGVEMRRLDLGDRRKFSLSFLSFPSPHLFCIRALISPLSLVSLPKSSLSFDVLENLFFFLVLLFVFGGERERERDGEGGVEAILSLTKIIYSELHLHSCTAHFLKIFDEISLDQMPTCLREIQSQEKKLLKSSVLQ